MKIAIDKFASSVIGYLSGEVTKVADLKSRFLMFAALGAVKANPSAFVNTYRTMLSSVGVIDNDGMVDTDAIRSALEMAFGNVPKVTLFGFTFNKDDAEAILHRMES